MGDESGEGRGGLFDATRFLRDEGIHERGVCIGEREMNEQRRSRSNDTDT